MRAQISGVAAAAAQWGAGLLDLLFPSRCVGCHRLGPPLCVQCLAACARVQPPLCSHCGRPLSTDHLVCGLCSVYRPSCHSKRSVAYHEGLLREAVHLLKYCRRADLASPLADLLGEYVRSAPQGWPTFEVITAVPLAPARQLERGYNQAEVLARALAQRIGLPYRAGLTRIRETADQVGLSAAERHANVRDAFQADAAAFRDLRVLLIDDVCTTGATLDACAAALQTGGAREIHGLTVTRPRDHLM